MIVKKLTISRLLNDVQQCTPQWGVQAIERSCDSKMAGLRPNKFAFAKRSEAMKAPVGLSSDRTGLRQQDGGAAPRQVRVCASNKHPCGVFEWQNVFAQAKWRGCAPTSSRLSNQQGFSAAG